MKETHLLFGGILSLVMVAQAQALVVNDTQTWGATRIENLAGGGLEVGPTGNLTITGRVDMDSGAWLRMSGGILNTTDTFKFPDSSGPQNVRMYIDSGTFTAYDIEHRGYDRDGIIYVGSGKLIVQTGYNSGSREYDPSMWLQDNTLLPDAGYSQVNLTDLGGGAVEITCGATIAFASASSGGVETITPALIPVNLVSPEPGETYTVQYDVIGGTATPGDDYSFTPGTLIFSPGQSTRNISIDIVNDGEPEEDETIILELSNATGLDVVLGIDQHTYTISDTRPKVSFLTATSSGLEGTTPALVAVKLSLASDETVTVDYAVNGGSATNGSDYILADGTLQFDPLDTTEYISIDIISDSGKEADETIILTLSDPCNATLGTITQHTRTIFDDEEGVVWDNKVWYYSDYSGGPYVNAEDQLEWDPEGDSQYTTRIPVQSLSQVGDVVQISYWWLSDGEDHESHPECEIGCQRKSEGCPCNYDDDIQCLAGTSDFRAGLFEADGEYVTQDGLGTSNSIFAGYKGYGFRFGPHMDSYPTYWKDCSEEAHKTGQFQKKPVDLSNLLKSNDGLSGNDDPIPGFELLPGEWSLWTISLERLSSSDVELSITLNDTTYTWIDGSSSDQPSKIDVFAINMRNSRPYDRLVLDKICVPPVGDMDGDEDEGWDDLSMFVYYWLNRCRPSQGWCAGADNNQDAKVNWVDYAGFAADWLESCE